MTKISVLYPNKKGSRFDMWYYIDTHMPMSIGALGAHPGYRGVSVERGLGSAEPGTEPAFVLRVMKNLALFSLAGFVLTLSGCMTNTVIYDARHPKPADNAPWANYLSLPITVPADIVTSPIQIPAFIDYCRGDRVRGQPVAIEGSSK